MNFPLCTAFAESHMFWYVVFLFVFICLHIFSKFSCDFFLDPLVVKEPVV